jgi:nucleoside-diphosphate-sugar epimerase
MASGKRVVIIGGTGFMGPWVARRLVEWGCEVAVVHRGERESEWLPDGVRHIHCDLRAFRLDFDADAVVHMFAMSEADALAAVERCRGRAGRLVVVSSGDVYRACGVLWRTEPGELEPVPVDEDSPLRSVLFPWGADYEKILVERAVLGASVVRLPAVYGIGDRHHRLWPWVKRMQDRRPALLLGAAYANWCWTHGYVENVADGIALAAVSPGAACRIFNLGEAVTPTVRERIETLGRVMGWTGQVVPVPDEQLPEHLRQPYRFEQDLIVDTGRVRRELRYFETVTEDEGLRRTIRWELAHPPESDGNQFDYPAEDAALDV